MDTKKSILDLLKTPDLKVIGAELLGDDEDGGKFYIVSIESMTHPHILSMTVSIPLEVADEYDLEYHPEEQPH